MYCLIWRGWEPLQACTPQPFTSSRSACLQDITTCIYFRNLKLTCLMIFTALLHWHKNGSRSYLGAVCWPDSVSFSQKSSFFSFPFFFFPLLFLFYPQGRFPRTKAPCTEGRKQRTGVQSSRLIYGCAHWETWNLLFLAVYTSQALPSPFRHAPLDQNRRWGLLVRVVEVPSIEEEDVRYETYLSCIPESSMPLCVCKPETAILRKACLQGWPLAGIWELDW